MRTALLLLSLAPAACALFEGPGDYTDAGSRAPDASADASQPAPPDATIDPPNPMDAGGAEDAKDAAVAVDAKDAAAPPDAADASDAG